MEKFEIIQTGASLKEIKRVLDDSLLNKMFTKLSVFRVPNTNLYKFAYVSREITDPSKHVAEIFNYKIGELEEILIEISLMSKTNYINNLSIIPPDVSCEYYVVTFTTRPRVRRNNVNDVEKADISKEENKENASKPYNKPTYGNRKYNHENKTEYKKTNRNNNREPKKEINIELDNSEYNSYMKSKNQRKRNYENKKNRK